MDKKIIEKLKENEDILYDSQSWFAILKTCLEVTQKEIDETKLPRYSPNDLYDLKISNEIGYNEVIGTLPNDMKLVLFKLLQIIQKEVQKKRDEEQKKRDEEQKKRDEEKVKVQRELNAELEKELSLKRSLELGGEEKSGQSMSKTFPNIPNPNSYFMEPL
jgi:hypothetical protein